jgi:DNA helicase-2/ATP-dependent DNA helicase PcrA
VAKIDVLREQTATMTLRDIMALMLEHSGLVAHYKADREGADRLENLDELVNAAESFVMQEGFGKDAAAQLQRQRQPTGPKPRQPGGLSAAPDPAALRSRTVARALGGADVIGDTGETLSPLVAFLTHAALEAGDNMAQAGQDAIQLMTVHSSKGLEFDCGVHHRHGRGPVPPRKLHERPRWPGGRTPPDVRGHHPRAQAPVPEPFAVAHAARPDPLQHEEPFL